MRKVLALLLTLSLILSVGAAGAAVFPLKGYGWDGNETELVLPEDCKMILLDCWQPWCYWCLKGMPDLAELYEQYKDKGLLVIGLYSYTDVDEYTQGKTARKLAEECGVTYPVLRISEDEIASLAQIGLPTTLILTGTGEYSGPMTEREMFFYTRAVYDIQYCEAYREGMISEDDEAYELIKLMTEDPDIMDEVAEAYPIEENPNGIINSYLPGYFWEEIVAERLGTAE